MIVLKNAASAGKKTSSSMTHSLHQSDERHRRLRETTKILSYYLKGETQLGGYSSIRVWQEAKNLVAAAFKK